MFAKSISVSVSALVKWEKKGVLLPVYKIPTGHRRYTRQQVADYFNRIRV